MKSTAEEKSANVEKSKSLFLTINYQNMNSEYVVGTPYTVFKPGSIYI